MPPPGQHTRDVNTSNFTVRIVALLCATSVGFQTRLGTGATPSAVRPTLLASDAASPDGAVEGFDEVRLGLQRTQPDQLLRWHTKIERKVKTKSDSGALAGALALCRLHPPIADIRQCRWDVRFVP